jgi:hypothetical protein
MNPDRNREEALFEEALQHRAPPWAETESADEANLLRRGVQ